MKVFNTSFFGGYNKNEVDEYVKKLEDELENIKKDVQEKEKNISEMQTKINELQKDVDGYEGSYSAIERVLTLAKQDATETVAAANADAETIKNKAAAEASAVKSQSEAECEARAEKIEQQFQNARYRVKNYVEALNKNHEQLLVISHEIEQLVKKMPFCVEDFLNDKDVEVVESGFVKMIGEKTEAADKAQKTEAVKDVEDTENADNPENTEASEG